MGDTNLLSSYKGEDKSLQERKILRIQRHPKYINGVAYYDIAILEVDDVRFSPTVRPICLPNAKDFKPDQYDQVSIQKREVRLV